MIIIIIIMIMIIIIIIIYNKPTIRWAWSSLLAEALEKQEP